MIQIIYIFGEADKQREREDFACMLNNYIQKDRVTKYSEECLLRISVFLISWLVKQAVGLQHSLLPLISIVHAGKEKRLFNYLVF